MGKTVREVIETAVNEYGLTEAHHVIAFLSGWYGGATADAGIVLAEIVKAGKGEKKLTLSERQANFINVLKFHVVCLYLLFAVC